MPSSGAVDLLDDEAGVHDIDGHRGVRGRAERRNVELGEAAARDRPQAELLQKRAAAAGCVVRVLRAGHLRRSVRLGRARRQSRSQSRERIYIDICIYT